MRVRAITALSLSATALLTVPAQASSPQTAKSLLPSKDSFPSFKLTARPGLAKGPLSEKLSCGKVALVPKHGTISSETLSREVSVTNGKATETLDQLDLTTVLAPTVASAHSILAGLRNADRHCPRQTVSSMIGDTPVSIVADVSTSSSGRVGQSDEGFFESAAQNGTLTSAGVVAPIGGSIDSLVLRRGRALTIVSLNRIAVTQSTDGKSIVSVVHVTDSRTHATLRAAAKIAVKKLANQTPA